MKFTAITALAAAMCLSGCIVIVNDEPDWYQQSQRVQHQFDANDIQTIKVNSASGDIKIVGEQGLTEIEVIGYIQTISDQIDTEQVLQFAQTSTELQISSDAWLDRGHDWRDPVSVDLTIRVPVDSEISLNNGAGDIEIKHIHAPVDIQDRSGHLKVSHIYGPLTVNDESGDISISHVHNRVVLTDLSGDVSLSHVHGKVDLNDTSGEISAQHMSGPFSIRDTSGDIELAHIGDVELLSDTSGSVTSHHTNIRQAAAE